MKRITAFRFFVFWIWSLTLVVTLSVFIGTLVHRSMTFKEIEASLTQIMGLIVPQISIMIAFFFGANKEKQTKLIARQQGLSSFAIGLSAFYHLSFWAVISLGIGFGIFGTTIDENSIASIKILGFLSVFGLSPVAYLFANNETGKASGRPG